MTLSQMRGVEEEHRDRMTEEVPGFRVSDQYNLLDIEDRQVPGLVFAALAAFILALQKNVMKGHAAQEPTIAIDRALNLIEEMAASGDDSLQNLVVTEIFENWDEGEASNLLRNRLGPSAAALYSRWIDPT